MNGNFIDNNYIKINYDPITGKKLIIDNELRNLLNLKKSKLQKEKPK